MASDVFSYRDKVENSSGSDSEDDEKATWKRKANNEQERADGCGINTKNLSAECALQKEKQLIVNKKRKANNIWCTVLEDQLMSEDLKECGLRKKPAHYGERDCESYDYTLKKLDPRENVEIEAEMSTEEIECNETGAIPSFKKKFQHKVSKYVELDSAGKQAAQKIARVLSEQKKYLIFRVVKYLGVEKAMELLKRTEDIEEAGGLMIQNMSRRKSPGGVYLSMLKSDKSISKSNMEKIFEGEHDLFYAMRHKRKWKKEKKKKKRSTLENMQVVPSIENGEKASLCDVPHDTETDMHGEEDSVELPNSCTQEGTIMADKELEEGEISN